MKTRWLSKRILALLLLAVPYFQGCGSKDNRAGSPPVEAAPKPKAGSVENLLAGSESAPPAPPPVTPGNETGSTSTAVPATEQPALESGQEAVLKELTTGLQVWLQVKDGYPKDLKQLADAKYISKVPIPPPGKKYAFDHKYHQVVLVDK